MDINQAIKTAKKTKPQKQDVYKIYKADREIKGFHYITGNEIWGYVHSPELFVKSDATGRMCRFFVQVDDKIFHPDELARAKVKRDGTVILSNIERLNIIDPIETRKKFVRSFDDALWFTYVYSNPNYTRPELDAHIITILDKDTKSEITMTRKEWNELLNQYRRNSQVSTFSEYIETV